MEDCHLHTIIRLPNGVFNPYTGIKTNLLFFTKGRPTDTIWFYEHRYPQGVKSYSKTKPLRIEELDPIADWWGSEADGFASRQESEVAWKVDFKQIKEEAEAKAMPHWTKAEALDVQVAELEDRAKGLRGNIKSCPDKASAASMETRLIELNEEIARVKQLAREEHAIGDRHYWPIYNLDRKNPNAPEEESHDPDKLLQKYRTVCQSIADTEARLKAELAAALAHHFTVEA